MAKWNDFLANTMSFNRVKTPYHWHCVFGVSTAAICFFLAVTFLISQIQFHLKADTDDEPFTVSSHSIIFEVHDGGQITVNLRKPLMEEAIVKVLVDDPDIIETISAFRLKPDLLDQPIYIPINSRDVAGHCVMSFKSKSQELEGLYKIRIKIKVVHHIVFGYLSIALGWCYLVCWGMSYYPQIYRNYARRSTVGFSYDFLALNTTGHLGYCAFNVSMYFNSYIQKSYADLYPKGELPVKIHDVLLSVHALVINVIFILQILLYERGGQRVSFTMATFVGGMWVSILAGLVGCFFGRFSWLQYLYYLCYVKLATTPIKYTPQLYLHCVRKSTEGWSIIAVFMDITGSCLCLLQMFCDALNNDDWAATIGNPGKLGLAGITFTYDIMFTIQHFFVYRNPNFIKKGKIADTPRELFGPLKVL